MAFFPKRPRTYQAGLLQARAYRILKKETARILKPYKIAPIEWAMLGLIAEHEKGLQVTALAEAVGVRAPFVTHVVSRFVDRGLVSRVEGKADRRTKNILLTKEGRALISEIEPKLVRGMKYLFKGVSAPRMLAYAQVLQSIVKNGTKKVTPLDDTL